MRCYAANGGSELGRVGTPGAVEVDAASCRALCDTTAGCTAVVTEVAGYVWTVHPDTNCYGGAGATELALPSAPAGVCYSMALAEC